MKWRRIEIHSLFLLPFCVMFLATAIWIFWFANTLASSSWQQVVLVLTGIFGVVAACGAFAIPCMMASEGDHIGIFLPWPRRREERLEAKMHKVRAAQGEVFTLLERMSEANPHRKNFELRAKQLQSAEEVLQIEMTYGVLKDLDGKVGRIVKCEGYGRRALARDKPEATTEVLENAEKPATP